MTSQTLKDYIQTQRIFRALKRNLDPSEIYMAATLCQMELLRELELVEETVQKTFVANQEIYTSTDWDFLLRMIRLRAVRNADAQSQLPILIRSKLYVDEEKYKVTCGQKSAPSPPLFCYELSSPVTSLGFWGVPQAPTTVEFTFVRGHADPMDNISSTKNPLIPAGYDDLMLDGTVVKLLDILLEDDTESETFEGAYRVRNEKYQAKLQAAKVKRALNRKTNLNFPRRMEVS